jgi:hypothetical protein
MRSGRPLRWRRDERHTPVSLLDFERAWAKSPGVPRCKDSHSSDAGQGVSTYSSGKELWRPARAVTLRGGYTGFALLPPVGRRKILIVKTSDSSDRHERFQGDREGLVFSLFVRLYWASEDR